LLKAKKKNPAIQTTPTVAAMKTTMPNTHLSHFGVSIFARIRP
jgi:hypothetical protein